jgi:serine/threonine protein kinase
LVSTSDELDTWLRYLKIQAIFTEISQDFEIKREIGKGSWGSVYLATSLENGRDYAIKVLEKEKLLADPETIRYLKQEIEILRLMNHEN